MKLKLFIINAKVKHIWHGYYYPDHDIWMLGRGGFLLDQNTFILNVSLFSLLMSFSYDVNESFVHQPVQLTFSFSNQLIAININVLNFGHGSSHVVNRN